MIYWTPVIYQQQKLSQTEERWVWVGYEREYCHFLPGFRLELSHISPVDTLHILSHSTVLLSNIFWRSLVSGPDLISSPDLSVKTTKNKIKIKIKIFDSRTQWRHKIFGNPNIHTSWTWMLIFRKIEMLTYKYKSLLYRQERNHSYFCFWSVILIFFLSVIVRDIITRICYFLVSQFYFMRHFYWRFSMRFFAKRNLWTCHGTL